MPFALRPAVYSLRVLLADDEPTIRLTIADALRSDGHEVVTAQDGAEAFEQAKRSVFDVLITDMRMPRLDGMALFRKLRELSPETRVIMITAYAGVHDAVSALKEGAVDYMTKPFDLDEIKLRVRRLAEHKQLEHDLGRARNALSAKDPSAILIGRSPPMVRLLGMLETVAQSDAPVLISGESGTGKELVARIIHARSSRADRSFVAVNCAAFPETLLEAELFGHERGAFTGAVKSREGRFQAASNGTLFLDEIAEIPPMAQVKLLRVIQEGIVEPLGTNQQISVDVRLISATHRNLRDRIKDGSFREDLFYRLNVLDLSIPPLRDRRSDIPLLIDHFMSKLIVPGKPIPTISPRAWAAISEYAFPGNVRELEHAIERAIVLSRGDEIDLPHLPEGISGAAPLDSATRSSEIRPLWMALKEFEREYLIRALEHTNGRKARAAEQLGISRKNLWEKLKSHGLELPTKRGPTSHADH
jgi:two-component system, NtrC family, response regulator AtoC